MSVTIRTQNLVKKYGNRTVVNNVSIEVKQGEIVGLLGPNGAGKTTSFYQVVGLIKPDEGKVYLNDQDITSLPMYKRAKMGIGYLPQEASIFRKLSVEDNITAILEMTKLPKQEQKDKLESLLNEFRLQHVRKSNGDVLSGGERRRTEIARALAVDPKFILLDEPFAGIDPIAVEDIQAIVAKLKHKNIGILITDHNVTETLSICDRAYLLIEGKIFIQGTAEELAANEDVRRLYLGRNFELKRKDYLHEEARGENVIQVEEAPEKNLNNLIRFTEHSIEKTKKFLSVIESILWERKAFGSMSVDLAAPEYFQQMKELKTSLNQFARDNSHLELIDKATQLPDLNYNKYRKIFKINDGVSMVGGMAKMLVSTLYKSKLLELKEDLNKTYSLLGTSILFLKSF